VFGDVNTIGGAAPGARNLVSGNGYNLEISGSFNTVQGNWAGPDITGKGSIGGIRGIDVSGKNNTIGGQGPGEGNLISGNGQGVAVFGSLNGVFGNRIGTDATGTA